MGHNRAASAPLGAAPRHVLQTVSPGLSRIMPTVPSAQAIALDSDRRLVMLLAALSAAGTLWSYGGASDKLIWAWEVLPVAVPTALVLWRRNWLSGISCLLLTGFYLIQCLAGRYTVAGVPFPRSIMEILDISRNPSDRIGHVFQGAVAAMLLREWLRRTTEVPGFGESPRSLTGWNRWQGRRRLADTPAFQAPAPPPPG